MKIDRQFNTMTLEECTLYIDNHKKYIDFNTLGLYRSILENDNLNFEQKIELREYAHKIFQKTFDFLQLKDPITFFKVSTLEQELTKADENQFWENIKGNQQKILADKKIKHRNFGIYSKHECGDITCAMNGMMFRQGSIAIRNCISFDTDKTKYNLEAKSKRQKKEQVKIKQKLRF